MIHYEKSEAAISIFFQNSPGKESHFNEISYLKPETLLRKGIQHRFSQCHFRICLGQLLLITFQGDYFCFHISTNKDVVANKDF